jgi:hypothetical protein
VRVAVLDLDVARAGGVRGTRKGPGERCVREQAGDEHDLPGLDVGPDAHGEFCIAIEAVVRCRSLTAGSAARNAAAAPEHEHSGLGLRRQRERERLRSVVEHRAHRSCRP